MRRIIGSVFLSLDGVMQGPGGPSEDITSGFDEGGWVFKVWDEGVEGMLGSLFGQPYDLLLGRRTYDIFAAYWPYVTGEAAAMGEAFTAANKYVLSHGAPHLDWANSHQLTGLDEVASLKAGDGPDLLIQGSGTLYPGLLDAGLLDRLTLMIFPVVIGRGKRLFGNDMQPGLLTMVDHKVTAKGTVIATYEPGGALPPLPAEAPAPSTSAREAERQRRMAEGSW